MNTQEKNKQNVDLVLTRLKQATNSITNNALSERLGVSKQTLSNWTKRNSLDWEMVLTFCLQEKIDIHWLLTGEGSISKKNESAIIPTSIGETYNIPLYNDIQVAAGSGIYNSEPIEPDSMLALPSHLLKRSAHYICSRVRGESMSPTIQDSSYVIARLLDKGEWQFMPDEHIYVVVSKEGQSFLKRVKNRFDKGFIVLMSDNPDKHTYGNFNLMTNEVQHIWHAEWYISARMPNIHDQFYSRLKRLEDDFEEMKNNFNKN